LIPDTAEQNLTHDIDTAVEEVCERVPGMREIVEAFAEVARVRETLSANNVRWPDAATFDASAFGAGRPLLDGFAPLEFRRSFGVAARGLLPVIKKVFPHIAPGVVRLRKALRKPGVAVPQILEAALGESPGGLDALAESMETSPGALAFLVRELLKPGFMAAAEHLGPLADDDLWCKGYCPVCGSGPDFGMLKEKPEKSEYLVSKSGRLHLHCALCGHVWRFVRLVCPSCGEEDHEELDVFTAEGREHERIHACRSCNRYLLVIDMVGSREKFHPELAPLGLVPLDLLARERGYEPVTPTPWNTFS
jgi:FdhE protein